MVRDQHAFSEETVLDRKDKAILRELFKNGRVSFSKVGRKVKLSKEVVHYRVHRLLEREVLMGFNTVIDVKKLGWQIYFVYLRLRNLELEKEQEIIQHLCEHAHVAWLVKCIGSYDFVLKIFVRSITEVNAILKELEGTFASHIDHYTLSYGREDLPVPISFLYGASDASVPQVLLTEPKETVHLEQLDLQILSCLANNARLPVSEIAVHVREPRETVKYHLRKLERDQIILKYRPGTWKGIKNMGYHWYLLSLQMGNVSRSLWKTLETYLVTHPNVTYLYKTIGDSDLQIEIKVKSSDELNETLMRIRSILKNTLKRHELLLILHEYKYTYFPKCMVRERK